MKEALFYSKLQNKVVKCELCPHFCKISENMIGKCRVRKNIGGNLFTLNYGKTVTFNIDPIEKKPLYHFYPGSNTLSLATTSCNFACKNCQNFEISQKYVIGTEITSKQILDFCLSHNIKIVSFTYTEPTIWYEFILDTCKILKDNNIKIVLVTNGFINPIPLQKISKFIDAMNIDLKSFDENFYKEICSGKLKPVLKAIMVAYENNLHLEITNLIITNLNDRQEDFLKLVLFIKSLDSEIPLHISRYFPVYKLMNQPTPLHILQRFYEIAQEYLTNVYLGNIIDEHKFSKTFCPKCGTLLIDRNKYQILQNTIIDGKCPECGTKIYGKF